MSCLKSTTYWVFLFHILHVKYGIKQPNSLSFFFIILASERHLWQYVYVLSPAVVPELRAAVGPEPAAALLAASPTEPAVRDRLRDCLHSLMTRDPAEIGRHLDSLVARLSAPGQYTLSTR